MNRGLRNQKQMLEVVPELDDECNRPPFASSAGKSLPQNPNANQHHQGIAIVQYFGLDEPRIPEAKYPVGFWPGPPHHVNLIGLDQMLAPVRQYNDHKYLQRSLMPHRVQFVIETRGCRRG